MHRVLGLLKQVGCRLHGCSPGLRARALSERITPFRKSCLEVPVMLCLLLSQHLHPRAATTIAESVTNQSSINSCIKSLNLVSYDPLPLLRGAERLLGEGKRWRDNPILKTPDLEDKVHVEEAEEEEQDDKQPSHLLCPSLFNWCHPSNWP